MTTVLLSHSGKQHSYHVARALDDLGFLGKFYTSSYITSSWLQRFLTKNNNRFWSRRFVAGLNGSKVEANWRFELYEMLFARFFGQSKDILNAVYKRDVSFDRYIARKMPALNGDIFWGFQGSCFQSLEAARQQDKLSICELATGHAPAAIRILGEEQRLHPEWADSFDNLTFPPDYYARLCEEPNRADVVIGASTFTLETLKNEGIEESKLRYLPLGFEPDRIPFSAVVKNKPGPLRLLYAGRITQRKGIKYLLDAMRAFRKEDVELHMIGNIHGSGRALKDYSNYTLHSPVSQYELFQKYHDYDALVLPSVFEGFGLVIVEAMAAGLPVITTAHTIGPELIDNGVNGFVVPIRDTQAIADAISKLLMKSTEGLAAMRQAARQAALNFSWEAYKVRLNFFLEQELDAVQR